MKRYELYAAHGIGDIAVSKLVRDNGEWVPADVAQALYDALRATSQALAWHCYGECRGWDETLKSTRDALQMSTFALGLADGKDNG